MDSWVKRSIVKLLFWTLVGQEKSFSFTHNWYRSFDMRQQFWNHGNFFITVNANTTAAQKGENQKRCDRPRFEAVIHALRLLVIIKVFKTAHYVITTTRCQNGLSTGGTGIQYIH